MASPHAWDYSKGNRKLSEGDVAKIRRLYAWGSFTYAQLGKKFGITAQEVGNIVRGEYWK